MGSRREALNQLNSRSAATTDDFSGGAGLSLDQVTQFYDLAAATPEVSEFMGSVPKVMKSATSGTIPTRSVAERIVRGKTEAVDDGYRAKLTHGSIPWATVDMRIPIEVSEDLFHENVEGEGYEGRLLEIMTNQFGADHEDLSWNGDTTTDPGADDYDFLKLNDGIIKSVVTGGNVVTAATYNGSAISEQHFFALAKLIDPRHIVRRPDRKLDAGQLVNTPYRFLLDWTQYNNWAAYCAQRMDEVGREAFLAMLGGSVKAPLGIPLEIIGNNFPSANLLLDKPQNHTKVFSRNLRIRRTVEGREAIMRDVRFYAIHAKADIITHEATAAAVVTGLSS